MNIQILLCSCALLLSLAGCKPAPESAPPATAPASGAVQPVAATSAAPVVADVVAPVACSFRLGFEAWEPYQYVGMEQKAAGLDIELIQAIADEMKCQLEFRQGNWTDLISALKKGELDLLPGASKTAARESFAYFSDPYRNEKFVLFIRSTDTALSQYATLAELLAAGKKVGIVSDYYYGETVAGFYNDDNLKAAFIESPLSELNLKRLQDEEIDAMFEDSLVGGSMLRRKGLAGQIGQHSIDLGQSDVYLMFSKNTVTEAQVAAFNQALQSIRQNGSYQAILAKYQ
jgi:polar amino acid transport system substrate-binding protein